MLFHVDPPAYCAKVPLVYKMEFDKPECMRSHACNAASRNHVPCSGARVFVNGREVALAELKGMFLRRRLDITEQLGSAGPAGQHGAPAQLPQQSATRNATLTVLVAPPDNVGKVDLGCGLQGTASAALPLLSGSHGPALGQTWYGKQDMSCIPGSGVFSNLMTLNL